MPGGGTRGTPRIFQRVPLGISEKPQFLYGSSVVEHTEHMEHPFLHGQMGFRAKHFPLSFAELDFLGAHSRSEGPMLQFHITMHRDTWRRVGTHTVKIIF